MLTSYIYPQPVGIANFPEVMVSSDKNQLGGLSMAQPKKKEEDLYRKMTISFEPRQMERVIDYCQRNDRGIAWVIRKALDMFLEKYGDRNDLE